MCRYAPFCLVTKRRPSGQRGICFGGFKQPVQSPHRSALFLLCHPDHRSERTGLSSAFGFCALSSRPEAGTSSPAGAEGPAVRPHQHCSAVPAPRSSHRQQRINGSDSRRDDSLFRSHNIRSNESIIASRTLRTLPPAKAGSPQMGRHTHHSASLRGGLTALPPRNTPDHAKPARSGKACCRARFDSYVRSAESMANSAGFLSPAEAGSRHLWHRHPPLTRWANHFRSAWRRSSLKSSLFNPCLHFGFDIKSDAAHDESAV